MASDRSRSRLRWIVLFAVVSGWVFWSSQGSLAELSGPTANDRQICREVARLMQNAHLLRHPLDDEISTRCLNLFLKTLDPWKVYFLQSDVDEFMESKVLLDDQIRKDSDIRFAYAVFQRLLTRIDERVALAPEFVAMEHDFTVDEEIVVDVDETHYAKDAEEARDMWRRRIKYDLLTLKAEALQAAKDAAKKAESGEKPSNHEKTPSAEEARQRLVRRYASFAKRMHQTDEDELLEMYLTSLTTAFDPHTTFMSPGTLENFEIMMRLNLDGIGATLRYDDGYTIVEELVPGGAAANAGCIAAKDRIVGVGQGEEGPIVDTQDMKLNDVVKLVRGKRGTVVRLKIIPSGAGEEKVVSITRAKIELTNSEARSKIVEQERNGQTYKIGVIDLPSFYMDMEGARRGDPNYKSTTRDVAALLADFREKNVDSVVLDLRRNGGGSLTEAIGLTGLFIADGPIVQIKDKDGAVDRFDDPDKTIAWDGPLVVLTSKFSASASEILAGAIQDYRRGLIVGDRSTHGKGTVQTVVDLGEQLFERRRNAPRLGALKITIQQFYRVSGDSTQARGVVADLELPSLTSYLRDISETDLDYALAFDKVDSTPFKQFADVGRDVVGRLDELSQERRRTSPDFHRVVRNIDRYQQQKSRKTVTLIEAKYLAEREELNADNEVEREVEELNTTERDVFDVKNFYNQEVLAITADYVGLTAKAAAK